MRHFLTLKDLSVAEIKDIIDLAREIKASPQKFAQKLTGKTLALIFQKTSTRTRVSFEAGMIQLGGHAIFIDWKSSNFTLGEISDEIKCLARYVDVIVARVYEQSDLELMAKVSRVPIINGLSDDYHPCQAISDLMTIYERFEDPTKIKVCFVGDGANNVSSCLIIGCTRFKIHINIGAPASHSVRPDILKYVESIGAKDYLHVYTNPYDAVKGANVLYTDTFVSMGQEDETKKRLQIFDGYQISKKLVQAAQTNPLIMHCLPAHRNLEIASEVLDSENSIVFDQAENRLHAQKAILLKILNPEFSGIQDRLFNY
jgi:ornithine carbamoyltransferase